MTCVRRSPVDEAQTDPQVQKDPRRVEALTGARTEISGFSGTAGAGAAGLVNKERLTPLSTP